ncbi:ciliary microtubule inner protein 2B isoform X1 [Alligator mississippiensis]|uniref:ciliary microtubule inner protein 2B isoform X1 n=1 Tax=Alligator mississippiensis TaxID=8496 RepID=UPI0028778701|nr:ciliary microtubule inner protein 2B isoform X1 [Alligator mississippiensis]
MMVQGAARGQTSARDPRGYPARAVRTTGTCPCTPNCTGTGILVPSQVSHGNTPHGAAPWGCLGLTRGRAVAGGSLHPPRWQEPSPATPGPFTPAARQMEPASPCLPHLTQSVPIAPGAQDAIQPRLLYAPDMWCPGFIPRAQHFFAKTYLEICKEARSDFARQQRRSWGGQEQPRACQPCLDPAQGSKEPAAGIPGSDHRLLPTVMGMAPLPAAAAPHGSPYSMEDDNPHKYFISGFTGFVPRARFLIGAGFPITTHRALLEFARMSRKDGSKPRAMGTSSLLPPLGRTYPAAGGLLPNYTGYIPGYKFQFGRTYGHLTHDALHLGLPEKQRPE